MKRTTLEIQNLKCQGCENTLQRALGQFEFVQNLRIAPNTGIVSFDTVPDKELQIIKNLLIRIGYPEVNDSNTLVTKAKSYVSCAIGRFGKKQ